MKKNREGRQKRLNEVYEYLRKYKGIHTKSGFAEAIKYGRTSLSAALNGKDKYLTDDLFENISDAYPGVFNLDYLLRGIGYLLTPEEEERIDRITRTVVLQPSDPPAKIDAAADIVELYAQRIRLVDDMRTSLREELEQVQQVRNELQQARDDFRTAMKQIRQAIATLNNDMISRRGYIAADG